MPNESVEPVKDRAAWQPTQVYAMAAVCLVVGLAIGYLFRGSQSPAAMPPASNAQSSVAPGAPGGMSGQMPSLDQMKHMADKKAAPLLEKLKSDPTNVDLLRQVGNIYQSTHQFKDAAELLRPSSEDGSKKCSHPYSTGLKLVLQRRCGRGDQPVADGVAIRSQGRQLAVQSRHDQVARKTGWQGSAGGLAGVVEVESAIKCGPQSRGTEADRRRSNAGQELEM